MELLGNLKSWGGLRRIVGKNETETDVNSQFQCKINKPDRQPSVIHSSQGDTDCISTEV